jgi:hypothetical protein
MYIFPCYLLRVLLILQTNCLIQVISPNVGTIATPCTTVQMHLSRDSDSTAGEPESGTLLDVDT